MDRRKPRVVIKPRVKERFIDINVAFALVDYVERSRTRRQLILGWGNLDATAVRTWLWENCSHQIDGIEPMLNKGTGGLIKSYDLLKFLKEGASDLTGVGADKTTEHMIQLVRRAVILK